VVVRKIFIESTVGLLILFILSILGSLAHASDDDFFGLIGSDDSGLSGLLSEYSVYWPVDDTFLSKYLCQTSSPPGIWNEETQRCETPDVGFVFKDTFLNSFVLCRNLGWKWTGRCCHPYEWQIDSAFLSYAAQRAGIGDCNGNGRVSPYDICVIGDNLYVEVGFSDNCRLIGPPSTALKINTFGLIGIFSGGKEVSSFVNLPGSRIPSWTSTSYFRGTLLRYTRSGSSGKPVFGPLINNIHPYPGLTFTIYSGNKRNLLPSAEASLISTVFKFLGGDRSVTLDTAILAKSEVVNHDVVANVIKKALRVVAGTSKPSCLIDPNLRGTICDTAFPNACCVWSYESRIRYCPWYTNPNPDTLDYLYVVADGANLLKLVCAPGFLGSWEGSYSTTLTKHWYLKYYVGSSATHYLHVNIRNPSFLKNFSTELGRQLAQEAIEEIKRNRSLASYNIENNPTWWGMRWYDGYNVYHLSMKPVAFCITMSDRGQTGFVGDCSLCNTASCRSCCLYIQNRCSSWVGSYPPSISTLRNVYECRGMFD